MGFLYHAINIPKAITITFFLNILTHARFLFIGALSHLGLYKPPPVEDPPNPRDNPNNYILILDPSSPSLVPLPVHAVTAAIKAGLPILQYQNLIPKQEQEEGLKVCSICLECIEWIHEIRELCGCSHLFHRECLDTWIDEGQVNCPLCRTMLLPPKAILNFTGCNRIRDRGVMRNDPQLLYT